MTAAGFTLTAGLIDLAALSAGQKNGSVAYSLISGNFTNGNGAFTYTVSSAGDLVVTAIPEPATYGLIGAGALAAVAMVRRRRAAQVA